MGRYSSEVSTTENPKHQEWCDIVLSSISAQGEGAAGVGWGAARDLIIELKAVIQLQKCGTVYPVHKFLCDTYQQCSSALYFQNGDNSALALEWVKGSGGTIMTHTSRYLNVWSV